VTIDIVAWGVGLIAIGAVIVFFGLRFLHNSHGVADDFYWSMAASRRGRRLTDAEPGAIRRMLGVPTVLFGVIFLALGIYGLVRGLIHG
jgi:hypothetical protein